jgi:hypothetical protein
MLSRMSLVRTEVSEELSASVIRVTTNGEIGITLALTRNRRPFFIVTAVKTSNLTHLWAVNTLLRGLFCYIFNLFNGSVSNQCYI